MTLLLIRNTELRIRLSEAQNHRCAYCGCKMDLAGAPIGAEPPPNMATVDHVVPRSKGGHKLWSNLVAACFRCNNLRGDMDARRFARIMGSPRGWANNPSYIGPSVEDRVRQSRLAVASAQSAKSADILLRSAAE